MAKEVLIKEAHGSDRASEYHYAKKTATGIEVSSPLIDAARSIGQTAKAASETGDGRCTAAAISSSEHAIKDNRNRLITGSLQIRVLTNHDEYEADATASRPR